MKIYTDEEFFKSPYRGVTSALSTIFGNKYDDPNIPAYILEQAKERGIATHKYLENYQKWLLDNKETEEPHLGIEYSIYEESFKSWLQDDRVNNDLKPIHTEFKIINKKLGLKGIIDSIAIVNGVCCLIDFKTSSKLDEWTTNLQLQLYYAMLSNGTKYEKELAKSITELRCLSLTKSGYRWFKFSIDKKLSQAVLKLWQTHYRRIAELEKLKERR